MHVYFGTLDFISYKLRMVNTWVQNIGSYVTNYMVSHILSPKLNIHHCENFMRDTVGNSSYGAHCTNSSPSYCSDKQAIDKDVTYLDPLGEGGGRGRIKGLRSACCYSTKVSVEDDDPFSVAGSSCWESRDLAECWATYEEGYSQPWTRRACWYANGNRFSEMYQTALQLINLFQVPCIFVPMWSGCKGKVALLRNEATRLKGTWRYNSTHS